MTSEQIETPALVVDDNAASETVDSTQQAPQAQEGKKHSKQQATRQRVPPEELYDLTKPLPKVSFISLSC